MGPFVRWSAIGGAVGALIVVIVAAAVNWTSVDNAGISLNGWIALILGVLVTLGVGVGLMSLVFYSNRRGYDEPPGKDR